MPESPEIKPSLSPPPHVRQATMGDVDAIHLLCRMSFPGSAQWQAPRWLGYRWWRMIIAAPCCEAWVWDDGSGVAGVMLLVLDERRWHGIRRRWCAHPIVQILMMLTKPKHLVGKIERRLRLRRLRRAAKTSGRAVEGSASDRVWGELLAVDPHVRGRGIGSALFKMHFLSGLRHNRSRFEFVVETTNTNARRLYAKLGAREVGTVASGILYTLPGLSAPEFAAAPGGPTEAGVAS